MILAFIKTYLLFIKIGVVVALILGAIWWHRHAMTVQFEKGQAAGQQQLFEEQAEELEKRTAEAQKSIDEQRAAIDATMAAVASERAALTSQRRQITATLNQSLGSLAGQETGLRNEIQSVVSDAGVIARVRLALERARIAERTRAPVVQ